MALTQQQHLDVSVEPLPYSKMPIHEWAKRMGLNPIHFAGGYISGFFGGQQVCSRSWPRFAWQSHSHISHDDVARALLDAEETIEENLKINVAPAWRTETHGYPRYKKIHRTNALDLTGRRPAIQMNRGHVIEVGEETRTYLGQVEVSYQDNDGDGLYELAYLNLDTDYSPQELELYPANYGFHKSFQIRWPRYYRAMDGEISYVIDFWLMLKPDATAYIPTDDPLSDMPDMADVSNFITHVDVYRVTSNTSGSVTFTWEPEPHEESAGPTTTTGSAIVRDGGAGLVAPTFPNGLTKLSPDKVTLSYRSGLVSESYAAGTSLDPMDEYLADAVFHLATARLHRDICGCSNAQALSESLRADMALSSAQGNFLAVSDTIQDNPFGTRRGEWLAYKQVLRAKKHFKVTVM